MVNCVWDGVAIAGIIIEEQAMQRAPRPGTVTIIKNGSMQ